LDAFEDMGELRLPGALNAVGHSKDGRQATCSKDMASLFGLASSSSSSSSSHHQVSSDRDNLHNLLVLQGMILKTLVILVFFNPFVS
jgi:hypothetical protein